jgi:hypothetical protein
VSGLFLTDNFERAGKQAPAAGGTILRVAVAGEFSVQIDFEAVEIFRTGGNAAAAAAASFRINYERSSL